MAGVSWGSCSSARVACRPSGVDRRRCRAANALAKLEASGATSVGTVQDVGDGIRTACVHLPNGEETMGIIENPHFSLLAA